MEARRARRYTTRLDAKHPSCDEDPCPPCAAATLILAVSGQSTRDVPDEAFLPLPWLDGSLEIRRLEKRGGEGEGEGGGGECGAIRPGLDAKHPSCDEEPCFPCAMALLIFAVSCHLTRMLTDEASLLPPLSGRPS